LPVSRRTAYPVDYEVLKREFNARRVFLYDCVEDQPRTGESPTDFETRVQRQQDEFDDIDKVEGVHVRYGYLSPGKKRHQKEVDVLLAVDMLTHSFSRNMTKAVLLSGDRDFKPVVESLVGLGTYVQLAHEPRSGARELARAADSEMEIDIMALCRWAKVGKYENRVDHFPWPVMYPNVESDPVLGMGPNRTLLRNGVVGPAKVPVVLYDVNGRQHVSVQLGPRDYMVHYFDDEPMLLAYLTKLYGEIVWLDPRGCSLVSSLPSTPTRGA
jgi:uncharacterized LabA/DUF88 family protein